MKSEREIEDEVRRWLEDEGHLSLRLAPEGVRGFPDLTVILDTGKVIFVEMKRPGGNLSIHQQGWVSRLRDLKCCVTVCCSLDKMKEFVTRILYETGDF